MDACAISRSPDSDGLELTNLKQIEESPRDPFPHTMCVCVCVITKIISKRKFQNRHYQHYYTTDAIIIIIMK